MMPDSTQNGEKSGVRSSGSKRRSDDKQQPKPDKKSSKQRASSSSSASIKTQQPTSRQKQEIHPIEHYADSPVQMIDQLFQTVQGEELAVLLPSILKNVSIDELKSLCLKQLQQMSKEEIVKIIIGVDESSDKCSAPPLPDSTSAETDVASVIRPKEDASTEVVPQVATASVAPRIPPTQASIPPVRKQASASGSKPLSAAETESNSDLSSSLTKMQMEILELELRARAIKALLRSQGMTDDKDEEMDTGEKHPNIKLTTK